MARKTNRTALPIVIGLGVLAILGGGAWLFLGQGGSAGAADALAQTPPALPKGKVQQVRSSVADERYLALDEISRDGKQVTLTALVIGKSATGLERGAAMIGQRKMVDCAAGRIQDGPVGYFDAEGRLIAAKPLYSGRRGRLIETEEAEAKVACGEPVVGRSQTYGDLRAAQRDVQTPPEGYDKIAASRPADPQPWAWLCAAGARGRWREVTPQTCDTAVKLNPASTELALDRAFLHLIKGERSTADAAFTAVLGKDPGNAAALFAKGLIAEMNGDKAASRRDRAAALSLDPQVVNGIEAVYGLTISSEYKTL